jgi:Na+/proline symporter
MWRTLTWIAAAALLAGAVFELALALGASSVGPKPGDEAAGQAIVAPVMGLAFLVGFVAATLGRDRAAALLAPAAGLLVTASFYTYDPYYAPTQRRYSDRGVLSPLWIFVVLGFSLAVGLFTWRRSRAGGPVTSAMLVVCGITGLLAGTGH